MTEQHTHSIEGRVWKCRGCGLAIETSDRRIPPFWSVVSTQDPETGRLAWRQIVCSPACLARTAQLMRPWPQELDNQEAALKRIEERGAY